MNYDEIANDEFGMDYDQLGPSEKEWVRDEYEELYGTCRNGKPWSKCNCC